MIKVFSTLRKNLLKEGKTTNYLKYAIGEIVLVVIGILIALSINSWNQNRIDKKRAFEYHQRLLEDVDQVLNQCKSLNRQANLVLKAIVNSVDVLEKGHISSEKEKKDFDFAILWFSRFNYQVPDISTLEEMKSNGDLNLIYNVELRQKIIDFNGFLYYSEHLFNAVGSTVQGNLFYFDKYIRRHVNPETLEQTDSFDFNEMAADNEFINHFSQLAIHWRTNCFFTKVITEKAKKLKQELTTELKAFND